MGGRVLRLAGSRWGRGSSRPPGGCWGPPAGWQHLMGRDGMLLGGIPRVGTGSWCPGYHWGGDTWVLMGSWCPGCHRGGDARVPITHTSPCHPKHRHPPAPTRSSSLHPPGAGLGDPVPFLPRLWGLWWLRAPSPACPPAPCCALGHCHRLQVAPARGRGRNARRSCRSTGTPTSPPGTCSGLRSAQARSGARSCRPSWRRASWCPW